MFPTRLSITTNITTTHAFWRTRSSILALALLASVVLALTLEADIAHAATFTVTNTSDSGPGSLRRAITDANTNNNPGTTDTIEFNIPVATDSGCDPGSGVCTILPDTELPEVTRSVVINGYSQAGSSPNTLTTGNNADLKIELSGTRGGNSAYGIRITGSNSVVKGLIVNRWNGFGIEVEGRDASDNTLEGNYIGTDAAAQDDPGRDLGNGFGGVLIVGSNNLVGGTSPGARNIISSNGTGVTVGESVTGNRIQGNYIGTDASGTRDLGNYFEGVVIAGSNNLVGGTSPGARNVISANLMGVWIADSDFPPGSPVTSGNRIQGNFIGTGANGRGVLGNFYEGVRIENAADNVVGGTSAAARNIIANSDGDGVLVLRPDATGNRILRNSIFDNGEIGIDLEGGDEDANEVTANDPRDADTGPNKRQNYPSIRSATTSGGQTTIQGTLRSSPNKTFTLQFFSSPTADPSGFGEGKTFLRQTNVTTDANGNASFSFTTEAPAVGQVVTATSTNSVTGNTSEFSRAFEVVEDNTPPTVISTNPRDGATGVVPAVNVTATFSEQMDAGTINSTTFKLFRKTGTTNTKVTAAVSYNSADKRATLNPSANLTPGISYVAQVMTGARDLSGNPLAQRKDFIFTVRR